MLGQGQDGKETPNGIMQAPNDKPLEDHTFDDAEICSPKSRKLLDDLVDHAMESVEEEEEEEADDGNDKTSKEGGGRGAKEIDESDKVPEDEDGHQSHGIYTRFITYLILRIVTVSF